MNEEWRLLIDFGAGGVPAATAGELIAALETEIGLHLADDSLVAYAYADSADAAAAAESRLRRELEKRGLGHLESAVEHWDHDGQEWTREDPASGSPADEGDSSEENESDDWARETPSAGSWRVTVSLEHRDEAKRLARELEAEAYDVSSSWHSLEVVTTGRDDAEALASEIALRAPGAQIEIASG